MPKKRNEKNNKRNGIAYIYKTKNCSLVPLVKSSNNVKDEVY